MSLYFSVEIVHVLAVVRLTNTRQYVHSPLYKPREHGHTTFSA